VTQDDFYREHWWLEKEAVIYYMYQGYTFTHEQNRNYDDLSDIWFIEHPEDKSMHECLQTTSHIDQYLTA